MSRESLTPPEASTFVVKKEQQPKIKKTALTITEKAEFYSLRQPLTDYCQRHFHSQEATVADMTQLFYDNNCTLADLMVTALVLAGRVNRYETIDPTTGEKNITIAAQEENKNEKKLPNSVENLFQELVRLLQVKETAK